MARIREYQQQTSVAPVPGGRRATADDFGGGAGLALAGKQLMDFADSLRQREEQAEVSGINADMAKAQADWAVRLDEKLRSAPPGDASFAQGVMDEFDAYMGTYAEAVQTGAGRGYFERAAAKLRGHVFTQAMAGQAKLAGAKARLDWDAAVNQAGAALTSDPSGFDLALERLELARDYAVQQGLPVASADELLMKGRSELARNAVQGLIRQNPDAAVADLNAGRWDGYLDGDKKVQLADQATREIHHRLALEERAERLAEKRQKQLGDEYAKELDAAWADGVLDRDAIERRRRYLSPAEYRGFLKLLQKPDEGRDDAETISVLQPRLHVDDIGDDLTRAFQAGKLKPETYRTMFNQNRAALKDDAPASPFKAGRGFLAQALDPGQLGGDPAIRQGLAIAQQRALADYDNWAEANPGFDRAAALKKSDELLAQYQTVAFGELRLALPRPRGFTGRKQDIEADAVEAARAEVLRLLDAGRLSRNEAARELEQLEIWERVLAPKKTGATP